MGRTTKGGKGGRKSGLTVTVSIPDLRKMLKAFKDLPKEASAELRKASGEIAKHLAEVSKSYARTDAAPQSRLLEPTIKVINDRVPAVQAGGSTRVGSRRTQAFNLLFGAEFGSNQYLQFHRAWNGKHGFWFFPSVEKEEDFIGQQWTKAATHIIDDWSEKIKDVTD
jgi:hypothetical protein